MEINRITMKIIVYTANIGNYDEINHVYIREPNIDFWYFNDSNEPVYGWKDEKVDKPHEDNTKSARYYKCNPHLVLPEHDISVWVDARFLVKAKNVTQFINESFRKRDKIACYPHFRNPIDGCAYKEAFICATYELDNPDIILKQIMRYQKEGFPKRHGLFATGIIIRRNIPEVNEFNELWWEEIQNGSKRDQISQVYCSWKKGLKITPIEGSIYGNKLVSKKKHLHKR